MISESEWISRASAELKRLNIEYIGDYSDDLTIPTEVQRLKLAQEMWDAIDPWDHKENVEEEVRNEVSYWHD